MNRRAALSTLLALPAAGSLLAQRAVASPAGGHAVTLAPLAFAGGWLGGRADGARLHGRVVLVDVLSTCSRSSASTASG